MIQIILSFLLTLFSSLSFANATEQCPSVQEIKNGYFHTWLPLYVDNEELASDEDVEIFKNNIQYLMLAHWNTDYLENARCYYYGQHPITQKIIFAHDAWRPLLPGKWHWIKPNKFAECHSNQSHDCAFIL